MYLVGIDPTGFIAAFISAAAIFALTLGLRKLYEEHKKEQETLMQRLDHKILQEEAAWKNLSVTKQEVSEYEDLKSKLQKLKDAQAKLSIYSEQRWQRLIQYQELMARLTQEDAREREMYRQALQHGREFMEQFNDSSKELIDPNVPHSERRSLAMELNYYNVASLSIYFAAFLAVWIGNMIHEDKAYRKRIQDSQRELEEYKKWRS